MSYASRLLKVHMKNHPINELKLVAIVYALMIWIHYLYGIHVNVYIDYKIF